MSVRLSLLQAYIKEDPFDEFLKYALALEYKSLGQNQEAYTQLKSLSETSPDYLPTYYTAGKLAEDLHKFPEAIDWYEKGIQLAINQKNEHALSELRGALNMLNDEMNED